MKRLFSLLAAVLSVLIFASCALGCAPYVSAELVCPDGAPAIILSALKNEEVSVKVYENANAVSAIGAHMVKGEVDYAILPVSNATKFNKQAANAYLMAGVITHGNLYAIALSEIGSIEQLKGKSMGVIQLNSIPGFAVREMLKSADIDYCTDFSQKTEDNVYLFNIQPAQAYLHLSDEDLAQDKKADLCVVAEPLCSKLIASKGVKRVIDLQQQNGAFPQAVLMVKKSVAASALTQRIINALSGFDARSADIDECVSFVQSKMSSTTTLVGITRDAIVGSNVYFTHARNAKEGVKNYISTIKTYDTALGSVAETVDDEFFME